MAAMGLALSACSSNVAIPPLPAHSPLFPTIDVHVGLSIPESARTYVHDLDPSTSHIWSVHFGEHVSGRVRMFSRAMFRDVTDLPNVPPWREAAPGVDAILELVSVSATGPVDYFFLDLEVCLYRPDASEIACWAESATDYVSDIPSERVEEAVREVLAKLLVNISKDERLQQWAATLPRKSF